MKFQTLNGSVLNLRIVLNFKMLYALTAAEVFLLYLACEPEF